MAKRQFPTREENYADWYNWLIQQAGLAENSAVRGCMVIKPYGYAIRENIKNILDQMFKLTGHENAYFPLFIPKSFLSKEAAHVEWFAKECAVVTHHRLRATEDGKGVEVDPEAKLEEELIVRPTSETIIWNTYKNWIGSYRDLPLLVNQWANVVRRELRTRAFLRTAEFLRQEGHTAHATADEAKQEAEKMLQVYGDLVKNFLAIDPVLGEKTEHERFAGADSTYTFECMMQDGKALQSWTSHFLGQNFAKAFDVTFANEQNEQEHVRATSRGVSTRLMWGLVMSHSDDQGLILPPAIAPIHVVVVPIFKTQEELDTIKEYLLSMTERLDDIVLEFKSEFGYKLPENPKFETGFRIPLKWKLDADPQKSPGRKFNERELKGVPVRIAVGKRDVENGTVEIFKRASWEKVAVSLEQAVIEIPKYLYKAQNHLLERNKEMRENNTFVVDSYDEFKEKVEQGFVSAHWDGTTETEVKIQEETKATIRCIPFDREEEDGKCIYSGNPSKGRVVFAKAY
jgi:prolyl-tRNA synthetase